MAILVDTNTVFLKTIHSTELLLNIQEGVLIIVLKNLEKNFFESIIL
jgi:hypothetical protein